MSLEAYLLGAFAVVLTGISKSGFAGGLGVLSVPLLATTMAPDAAAAVLLPILLGIDVLSVWRYRASWQLRTILVLLPGALVGIGLGLSGFARVEPEILRIGIGVLALAFVAGYFLAPTPQAAGPARLGLARVFLASTLSGFAGFVAHAGGPPIKGTLLRMGLNKTSFVSTNAIFFFMLNISKLIGYLALGLFTSSGLIFSVALSPFLFVGVALGFALHDRLPQVIFMWLAYALLALAGLNLLGSAAIALLA